MSTAEAPRPAHDVQNVIVAFGGDQPDTGATFLDHGVGAHGRTMGQNRRPANQIIRTDCQLLCRERHGIHQTFSKIVRRRWRFHRRDRSLLIDYDAIGERPTNIDTDQI